MTTKTITIRKRGGGTRKQKVQVLKSGKFRFIKNSGRSAKRRVSSVKRVTRRKSTVVKRVITKVRPRRTMAKRRRSTSRKSSSGVVGQVKRFAKPIAIGLGITGLMGIAGQALGQPALANNKLLGAGGAFLLGGPVAGGAALLLNGGLGNLFGGGGQSNGDSGLA